MNTSPDGTRRSIATTATCLIRRGAVSDAVALSAFAARTFTDTYGADNRPEDLQSHLASSYTPAQQQRELIDREVETLLAYSADQLVAYAQVRRGQAPACVSVAGAIELQRFYVDRPWHGRGISQCLMTAVRVAAIGFGGAALWLKVWERNPRAIAFYSKMDFVDVGMTDFFVGSDRQTDRVLLLDLRA